MKQQLASFQKGILPLGSLVGDLEFLLNAMESVDITWKEKVFEEIANLEEIYAIALDRDMNEIDDKGKAMIYQSIKKLSFYFEEYTF